MENQSRLPWLLSADEKRRFFTCLDALLSSNTRQSPSRRRRRSRNETPVPVADEAAPSIPVMTNHAGEPMGRGDGNSNSHHQSESESDSTTTNKVNASAATTSAIATEMTRTLPIFGKRPLDHGTSPPPPSSNEKPPPQHKRSKLTKTKRMNSLDPQEMLLRGKRVVLVPIGRDVSKKRLEIWQEMVDALGGTTVESSMMASPQQKNKKPQEPRPLLHLTHRRSSDGSGVGECKEDDKDKSSLIDWDHVDLVVVSAAVDMKRLQQHFHGESPFLIPSHVQLVTPEWLVYVRQQKKFPQDGTTYDWRYQQQETIRKTQEETATATAHQEHHGAVDDESDGEENGDGSDRKNTTNQEIIRAPPVEMDTEKMKQEEKEMELKKHKLVNERIPIFHKLNPRFETLAHANQAQKLKMEAFVCQKSSLMQANLNAHLTTPLEDLMGFLHVERDIWREYSYKKIVSSLKAMRTRVSSVKDLKGLWWAKGRMREKVVEILETGNLEKLEAKKTNPRLRSLVEMSRIWGVGPATAAKLYNAGYKNLEALREHAKEVLNFQQQIGLKHYDDFLTKIPRPEVQQIEKTVVDEIHKLLPNATALACGSYRRGKPSSGDCDILITDPDSEECDILPELLRRLHETGFLTDDLTHVSDHRMGRCDSYMGVCRLGEGYLHRRLDIKVYPRRFFGFALLYFTGSDHFNRSMRLFARKKGWSLSDRALKRVVRVKKGVTIESGDSVVCPHEVDVFIALGLEYKDPTERNCFDIRFVEEDEANAKKGGKTVENEDALGVGGE